MRRLGVKVGLWIRRLRRQALARKKGPTPIRFPGEKSEKQAIMERKKMDENRENDFLARKHGKMRVKFPAPHKPCTVGPGYPSLALAYANLDIVRGERTRKVLKRTESGIPFVFEPLRTELPHPVPDPIFDEYCQRLGIRPYKGILPPEESKEWRNDLDLKECDLHNEDVKIERNIVMNQLKFVIDKERKKPLRFHHLREIETCIYNISRSCYYSPTSCHEELEDMVQLIVWLMGKKNIPVGFHLKMMQALSVTVAVSPVLKAELARIKGVKMLYKSMQVGLLLAPLQACWACYTLVMAGIGSPQVIGQLQKIQDLDETISELSTGMYWRLWPTNFAIILQGLVFGPSSVANGDDYFSLI